MAIIEHALPEVLRWIRDPSSAVTVTLVTREGPTVYRGALDDVRFELSQYEAAPHESEILEVHVRREARGA